MNIWLGLLLGLKEISSHKFRSFLTMLGIILGVASLLSMFSLTAGMAKGMREYMQQVGGIEKVGIINQDVPVEQEGYAEISPGRTVADAEAIRKSAHLVSYVTPVSELQSCAITRANQIFRSFVVGAWPDYVPINKHEVARGRGLSEMDVENAQRVCVIGDGITQRLWPEIPRFNPIGQSIMLNGRPFTVVGEFAHYEREEDKRKREQAAKAPPAERDPGRKRPAGGGPGGGGGRGGGNRGGGPGNGMFDRKNATVLIPISTMFYEFKSANVVGKEDQGPNYKLDQLSFQVADTAAFQQTMDQVQGIVGAMHRGIEDFTFDTRQEWFDTIEESVQSTRLSGGMIAGISLLVGGIGITNIMLASITERIREIGVRRAVGAKGRDIFVQIVVESAVIGFIGGVLGLVASLGIMKILVLISEKNAPVVELPAVLVSFSFALFIGVTSGLYPAIKASRLDPIEALRYG
ncbi:MAG: ABC transporter permease [Verrucomicrobiota bacterium]